MNSLKNLTKENLHHAYILTSNFESIEKELLEFFENNLGVETVANDFFTLEKYDKFLVDDAHKIFDLHLRKTPRDTIQVIVLNFNFITREAQNALLKMLEEPRPQTYFFIVAPSRNLFLETILSRVNLIQDSRFMIQNSGKKFLKMSIGERMKFIANLVKDIKDEKKTKQKAIDLLSQLEVDIEQEARSEKREKKFNSLKTILNARKYINLNGASIKILLETVALNV